MHSNNTVPSVPNFLTLDVEEWFDAEIPRRKLGRIPEETSRLEEQISLYLEICEQLNIKSTCFVVGKLAEKKPSIVKMLHGAGHEIASHSYAHQLVYAMEPESFKEDLHRSIGLLQDITGSKVTGFRAPSWSVNADVAPWFYPILEEEQLDYSSSVYPAKTFLYGMPEADSAIHSVPGTSIVEIPQQLMDLGLLKTGIAGGTYLRLLPSFMVKRFIRQKNGQGHPVFVYLHPWELIYQKYPVELSFTESIIQYTGIKKNSGKIRAVCSSFQSSFIRMDQFVAELNK